MVSFAVTRRVGDPVGSGPGLSVPEGLSGPVGPTGAWHGTDAPWRSEDHLFQLLVYVTVLKGGVVGLSLGTRWLGLG